MAHVLVVGGGVSGLSAGIYLKIAGHRVTICEKNSVAGGNLTGWQRDGYTIDNCIHWLTGTNPASDLYRMWEELGALGGVKIHRPHTLYTCEYDGLRLSLFRDLDLTEEQMIKASPADERETRSLIRAVRTMQYWSGVGGENHDTGLVLRDVMRLPPLLKYYNLTVKELSERFQNPLLRMFISSFLGDDFGAVALLSVFATFTSENGDIPEGGSCAMAKRMTDRFCTLGGELLLKKEAVGIDRDSDGALYSAFKDGSVIKSDYIVLATDPVTSFHRLLSSPLPRKLARKYQNPRYKRFSSYHFAFSSESIDLPFQGDFLFEVPKKYRALLSADRIVLREFSHEPTFAPRGHALIQVMVFCCEDTARSFIELRRRDPEAYKEKKAKLSKLVEHIITHKLPALKGKLKCLDVWTPATYNRYTGEEIGAYMSFITPSKEIPLPSPFNLLQNKKIILATQWLHSPGGLPIAAARGRAAAEKIIKAEEKHGRIPAHRAYRLSGN